VTPKSFTCKGEPSVTAFKATDYGYEDEEVWDFGPSPTAGGSPPLHCSYSYHLPYYKLGEPVFALSTASSEPGMAIAADRNPWLDPSARTMEFQPGVFTVTGPLNIKTYQYGNAAAHQRDGQNVLFMDNHVYFEKESYCGVDEDNIYLACNNLQDRRVGDDLVCPNTFLEVPIDRIDSLLVNECTTLAGPPIPPPIITPPP
jgi:hypothetical protein